MRVKIAKAVLKFIRTLKDPKLILKIESLFEDFTHDPFPRQFKRIKNTRTPHFRIRIGDYRVIYEYVETEQEIRVKEICHRKNCKYYD